MNAANRKCERLGASRRFVALLSAIHPILRFQNINHDLLQILIGINELNIAALGPNFLVLNRIFTLPQYTSRIRLELIPNAFYSVCDAIVLVARFWHKRNRYVDVIRTRRYSVQSPSAMFCVFANDVLDRVTVIRIEQNRFLLHPHFAPFLKNGLRLLLALLPFHPTTSITWQP